MATVISNIVILGCGVATGVATARGLAPDDRGHLLAVVLWSGTVAAFSLMGLDHALVYGSRGGWNRAMSTSAGLRRRVWLLGSAGSAVAMSVNLLLLGSLSLTAWLVAAVGASAVLLNASTQLRLIPLLASGRVLRWNIARVVSPVAYLTLISMLVWWQSLTVYSALLALAAGNLVTLAFAFLATLRPRVDSFDEVDSPTLIKYGYRMLTSTVPSYLGSRLDQLTLGVLLAPAVLGVYAVAASIAAMGEVVKLTVDQLLFPHLMRTGWRYADVRRMSVLITTVIALLSTAAMPFAGSAIELVYGSDYTGARGPLRWLLLAVAFRVGVSVFAAAAKAAGQLKVLAVGELVGLLITAMAVAVFLPIWGSQGAALAVTCGQIGNWCVLARRLRHVDGRTHAPPHLERAE